MLKGLIRGQVLQTFWTGESCVVGLSYTPCLMFSSTMASAHKMPVALPAVTLLHVPTEGESPALENHSSNWVITH